MTGIKVGHQFYSRAEMVVVGFHSHWLNGIDYMGQSYSKVVILFIIAMLSWVSLWFKPMEIGPFYLWLPPDIILNLMPCLYSLSVFPLQSCSTVTMNFHLLWPLSCRACMRMISIMRRMLCIRVRVGIIWLAINVKMGIRCWSEVIWHSRCVSLNLSGNKNSFWVILLYTSLEGKYLVS